MRDNSVRTERLVTPMSVGERAQIRRRHAWRTVFAAVRTILQRAQRHLPSVSAATTAVGR